MEQLNEENTKLMTTHLRLSPNFIKKSLSLLQSPYSFSLLLFFSSLLFLIFHTLKPYSSPSSLISVLKFSFDRNHMFLICNGILVILVKSSSSSSSSSSSLSSPPLQTKESKVAEMGAERKQVLEPVEQSNPDENPRFSTIGESSREEVEVSELFDVHDQKEDGCVVVDDYDDEEEEGLAAEELNKRCEEFIRRMKQGIISESRGDPSLARFC